MVAIFATQWDKFISSTLRGTCCPMDPYFISSMGPWICFPSTRGGTGGSPPPTTPARMVGDLSSCHDSGRSHPRHQALRWPCGTCGACLVSAPENCSMSMWVVWKRQTSRPFKICRGILELVPSTSAWIIRYIISHHPIISVSHLWIIIRSLVGVKMPQEAQVLLGFMPESFRDLAVLNGWCPKLSIVW